MPSAQHPMFELLDRSVSGYEEIAEKVRLDVGLKLLIKPIKHMSPIKGKLSQGNGRMYREFAFCKSAHLE
jgi:hypothetical protein